MSSRGLSRRETARRAGRSAGPGSPSPRSPGCCALWAALAALNGDPRAAAGPWTSAPLIWREIVVGRAARPTSRRRCARVVLAFVLAMSIGMALGLVDGAQPAARPLARPVADGVPEPAGAGDDRARYLWIGLNEIAAVAAVALNKIPTVVAMMREGARALDPGSTPWRAVFRMGRLARLRHVVVPQLAPYIAAAARSGIALIWKIVLVVEFLGRSNGIGFKIHLYFQLFDVGMVLVYALSFVVGDAGDRDAGAAAAGSGGRAGGARRDRARAARRKAFGADRGAAGRSRSRSRAGETRGGARAVGRRQVDAAAHRRRARPRLRRQAARARSGSAMVFQEPTLLPWRSAPREPHADHRRARGRRPRRRSTEVGLGGRGEALSRPAVARPAAAAGAGAGLRGRAASCCCSTSPSSRSTRRASRRCWR